MILSSLGSVFQSEYHFPPTTSGLSYLGLSVGGMIGLASSKKLITLATKALPNGHRGGDHAKLLPFISGACTVPFAGLAWYGWSVQGHVHWIVPVLGLFFFGFGYMCVQVMKSRHPRIAQ
jgi:hypothetical protein